MNAFPISTTKYTFSGHESFQCRQLWLKKGYDFIVAGRSFRDEDAVVALGVGKNMVSSIRFWLKAFNLIDTDENLTEFAIAIFNDENGFDPYLEDDATLWLLHYQLIKNRFASTYSLIFNELRREKIEFIGDNYVAFIKRKSEIEAGLSFNSNTIYADFDVFKKMYYTENDSKQADDSYSGLLTDLGLIKRFIKLVEVNNLQKEKKEFFFIENSDRKNIPVEIFLYSILDNSNYGLSISTNTLEQDYDSPGSIFAMNSNGIADKIIEATELFDYITFNDHAGIKEMQFKNKPSPFELLKIYYEK
jgi:hypothetical protein